MTLIIEDLYRLDSVRDVSNAQAELIEVLNKETFQLYEVVRQDSLIVNSLKREILLDSARYENQKEQSGVWEKEAKKFKTQRNIAGIVAVLVLLLKVVSL